MAYLILPPEYLPQLQMVVNWFMSFTPLISYGTTIAGIQRDKSSAGFSIDICCTMLVASILRIFFFLTEPFEIALLRQCFSMVFVQIILLRTALKFRSLDFEELQEYPSPIPELADRADQSVALLRNKLDGLTDYTDLPGTLGKVVEFIVLSNREVLTTILFVLLSVAKRFLSFFNGIYRRPFKFWQWKSESTYWKFLAGFLAVVSCLQLLFWKNEQFGMLIGSISFLVESSLPLPQILLFNRIKSVEGFRTILLLSWLGGDLTKLSYLLYGTNDISTIFVIAALFQMSLNLVITYQFFHYRRRDKLIMDIPLTDQRQRSSSVNYHEADFVQHREN